MWNYPDGCSGPPDEPSHLPCNNCSRNIDIEELSEDYYCEECTIECEGCKGIMLFGGELNDKFFCEGCIEEWFVCSACKKLVNPDDDDFADWYPCCSSNCLDSKGNKD